MIRSTPATALIKTNRKTEMRCIHSWTSRGRFSAESRRIVGVSAEGPGGSGALPGAPENMGSLIQGSSGSAGQIRVRCIPVKKTSKAIQPILRLQGLNALGDIAIIDVASVYIHEMLERRGFISSGLVGGGEFIIQGHARFPVDRGNVEGLIVPTNCGFGHPFFEEALSQPGVGLHDLR